MKVTPKQSSGSHRNFKYVLRGDGIYSTICKTASSVLQDIKHTAALLFHSTHWPLTSHRALATDGREST